MNVSRQETTNNQIPARSEAEASARVAGIQVRVNYDYGELQKTAHHRVISARRMLSGLAVVVDAGAGQSSISPEGEMLIPGGEIILSIEPARSRRVLGPSIVAEDRMTLLSILGEVR